MNCSNELGFAYHYEKNMQALGLPAPTTFYTSLAAATAAIKSMADAISLYGRTATMSQLAMRATWGYSMAPIVSRVGGIVLSVGAAYYVGACIGSVAVAAIKANGCNAKATINVTIQIP